MPADSPHWLSSLLTHLRNILLIPDSHDLKSWPSSILQLILTDADAASLTLPHSLLTPLSVSFHPLPSPPPSPLPPPLPPPPSLSPPPPHPPPPPPLPLPSSTCTSIHFFFSTTVVSVFLLYFLIYLLVQLIFTLPPLPPRSCFLCSFYYTWSSSLYVFSPPYS